MIALKQKIRGIAAALALGIAAAAQPAAAEDIVVTHFGSAMYGIPYSVALAKGWFKEAGLDITGILTSKGGGTSVRNLMAGDTLYAEVAVAAALAAIKEGYDIKIVNAGTIGRNGFWIARGDDKIDAPKDLKGKAIGFSRPKSSSESQALAFLKLHGVPLADVKMVAAGDIAAGITALVNDKVDIALATEPAYSVSVRNGLKLKPLIWLDKDVPSPTQTVGIATGEAIRKNGDKLKILLQVRQRAVRYVYENPQDAAAIAAKDMRLDPELVFQMIKNVRAISPQWWSEGAFNMATLNTVAEDLASFDQIQLPVKWDEIIDRSFLPADLRS